VRSASRLLGGTLARRREQIGDSLDRRRHEPVVRPHAALLPLQQAGFGEDTQVVAHSRLRKTDRGGQIADARLAIRRSLDEAEQAQARRVGECLEDTRQSLSIDTVIRLAIKRRNLGQ